MSTIPRAFIATTYAEAALDYLRELRTHHPEHFMEAAAQGTQRKITLESLDLVHARRPEVQIFNELLVQYPRDGQKRPGQVVPDNMVVIHPEPIDVEGSFDTPLQPVGPFWMLEYVSKFNRRKDYEDNFDRYEKELRVPYYLTFYPDNQEVTLYRLERGRYVTVLPNEDGRYSIAELEMEVALLDGWVRFWFRGELLPLPADLVRKVDELNRELRETRQERDRAREQVDTIQQKLDAEKEARLAVEQELERLRAQLGEKKKKRPRGS